MADNNTATLINLTTNTDDEHSNRYLLEFGTRVKSMMQPKREDEDVYTIQASDS